MMSLCFSSYQKIKNYFKDSYAITYEKLKKMLSFIRHCINILSFISFNNNYSSIKFNNSISLNVLYTCLKM